MPVCSLRGFEVIRLQSNVCSRLSTIQNGPLSPVISSASKSFPKPSTFASKPKPLSYEAYFASIVEMVEVSPALVAHAYDEAQRVGLAGMDALHIAAAKAAGVTESITVEKPTKPLFRV